MRRRHLKRFALDLCSPAVMAQDKENQEHVFSDHRDLVGFISQYHSRINSSSSLKFPQMSPQTEQWGDLMGCGQSDGGWLGQGVFRALLLHTKSHQNTLAHCRGDPQSLKGMTATGFYCHPAHLKKHSATDWRPSFVSWGYIFKFIWSNSGHLCPGLSQETQSHGYSPSFRKQLMS